MEIPYRKCEEGKRFGEESAKRLQITTHTDMSPAVDPQQGQIQGSELHG